jgi:hypothetical protein
MKFTKYGVTYKTKEVFGNGEFFEASHETEGVIVTRRVWIPMDHINDISYIIDKFGD